MASQPVPIPSPLDAATQIFPVLTPAQIARVRSCSKLRTVQPDEILFELGDSDVSFFVLLSGAMEVVQLDISGAERPIVKLSAGEFTGELSMISGGRSLARGRVTAAGEFLELRTREFRSLIARDSELSDIFMRAFILRRIALIRDSRGPVLLGSRHSAATLGLREFLSRNGVPYNYVDLDIDKSSQDLLDRFQIKVDEIPVIICSRAVMRNPTIPKLADCLGLNASVDQTTVRDLVIIGAGPSGLAAAVYAASEGLDALVIETDAPGGQAGSSSKIENYLGFPMGISGQELAARASAQAAKFGAKMMVAHSVARLDCDRRPYQVVLENGNAIHSRAVVISTGAQYNKPRIANLQQFEGRGVYYGATFIEAQLCEREEVIVIGGGNSAGQAATYLSQCAARVHMLVRSGGLSNTMSRYLIQRVQQNPDIEMHFNTEIVSLEGSEHLDRVSWRDKTTGETTSRPIRHVFIMAGGSPRTDWLQGCVALDNKGFILTGRDLGADPLLEKHWPLERAPLNLETSLPGVFAVGDVRSGSVKRVASAVGEGAMAIALVHRALAEL